MAIFIAHKINNKSKTVMRQLKSLYNDKRVNSTEKQNNYKHITNLQQSTQIYEANSDRLKEEIDSNTIIIEYLNIIFHFNYEQINLRVDI